MFILGHKGDSRRGERSREAYTICLWRPMHLLIDSSTVHQSLLKANKRKRESSESVERVGDQLAAAVL